MGDDHEEQQPVGGMQDDSDWCGRMEAKVDKIDDELVQQRQMLVAMMQHFNIQCPSSGPV